VAQGIARGALPEASLAALRQHAARAVAEDPLAGNAWLARGTLALLAGDAESALDAYLVAQRSGRRPEIHLGLARAHRQRGDDAAAQHETRKLRRLAPSLRRELARWDGRLGPQGEVPWERLRRHRPPAPAR
jgi:cytochrome c-type biogenesis protein CcmH/NrfG